MSSPPCPGNTLANGPSSPNNYTLSDITGIGLIDRRSAAERVDAIFTNHLGGGWEERLRVHRTTRERAYSEANTTVTSFCIPGSFVPPRPAAPLPHRLHIPAFTPLTQSTSCRPTQSTPFRFHSPPRPNPSFPRNQQTLPSDLSDHLVLTRLAFINVNGATTSFAHVLPKLQSLPAP
ncbi:hypothetical protein PSTG_04115 [Puccinia striiformis f. sp. tritici PST-78]|uniref:Uncharacterized protein n=1 Tax=Puccinia striiformis f. sp. tritici PST-78 TaxID=1165861 RepID=A0A0L0VUY9_9BASI|nr:hypothetical protein PSTG_04115 [Puccinia striiformis f. sp. tritici PST-78]